MTMQSDSSALLALLSTGSGEAMGLTEVKINEAFPFLGEFQRDSRGGKTAAPAPVIKIAKTCISRLTRQGVLSRVRTCLGLMPLAAGG